MFKGHPKALYALALANTGERFGYYTMLAVFALFLRENFGWEPDFAGIIYSTFLGFVYFMPLLGGVMADKFGYGKMVTIGISIMFVGYLLLSAPLGGDVLAMVAMFGALLLIALGTGLFKGNLQVMVGNLYDDPKYADKRDSAFSLFYMAINIGALFAPTAAVKIKDWAEDSLGFSGNDAYHFSFAVACVALVVSMIIYFACRKWYKHVEGGKKGDKGAVAQVEDTLTPAETKARIVALCLVFAVVIFFWMAFHQNGLALTYFADEFTNTKAFGLDTMLFDVWNLVLIIVAVYATFSIFQSKGVVAKLVSGLIGSGVLAFLVYRALGAEGAEEAVDAEIFQQFNPFYVVALTPFSMAIFGALAKSGKEPSAPRKIAYGMLVAAVGFSVMAYGSMGLNTPDEQNKRIVFEKAEALAVGMSKAQSLEDEKAKTEAVAKATADKNDFVGTYEDILKDSKDKEEIAEANEILALFNDVYTAKEQSLAGGEEKEAADAKLAEINAQIPASTRVSPYWLILTYLILTFAELLLSPMGISFVSKVAPPKYKGMMMGGWFVATAIGNFLVAVGGLLWGGFSLTVVWSVFIVLCLLSALFMFVMMKRLESATK